MSMVEFDWFELVYAYTANHSCCEFLSTAAMSCPRDGVSQLCSQSLGSYTLLPFPQYLLFLAGLDTDDPLKAEGSTQIRF